eukprot:748997-Rhodomonas_salina.1
MESRRALTVQIVAVILANHVRHIDFCHVLRKSFVCSQMNNSTNSTSPSSGWHRCASHVNIRGTPSSERWSAAHASSTRSTSTTLRCTAVNTLSILSALLPVGLVAANPNF